MISHRLGLLSLTTDLKTYNLLEECSCKGAGCAKCQSIITLSAEGPLTVYASDLKFKDELELPIKEGESVHLPFRYVLIKGKPLVYPKLMHYLKTKKGF